jgi:hypothetical protein
MHYRRLGLGVLAWTGVGTLLGSGCSSGSSLGPAPLAGRPSVDGGASGSGGRSGSGSSAEGGMLEGQGGGDAGSAGSSTAGTAGTSGSGGTMNLPAGAGVGDDCSDGTRCRPGLECLDGACTPAGTLNPGEPCVIQPECAAGLQCVIGSCIPAGDREAGESCMRDDDCAAGLKCVITGLEASCAPQGDGDVGGDCERSTDCFTGLACVNEACTPQNPSLLWPGVECEPSNPDDVRAYFEVPGADDALEGDFFRLPFPNDALRTDDGLDLSGFPTPGPGLVGVDAVKLYVDALEGDDAWGGYGTVYFRFSGPLEIYYDNGEQRLQVAWVDVTPGSPDLGASAGLGFYYSGGGSAYICQDWIGVRRPRGFPLVPGHTYAVWITTEVVAADGSPVIRPPNLVAVLDDDEPDDPALARAHEAFAPFRAYLSAENTSTAEVLTATVFTVGGLRGTMADLAAAVDELPAPTVEDGWTKCEDGVDSPCPDHEGSRNCGAGSSDYDEYHALVRLPIYQQGTAPYLTPEDGGNIVIESDPATEDVCLALTVPTGTMPDTGWPLAVYAHGTGGSFRDHASSSVAGALSRGDVKFAVLGIDQVAHGPRRGASDRDPDELFFNFLNPKAARGNPLQGAVDQISLAKFAATIDGSDEMPTTIDATKLVFFGHSQGSTEGSLMLPYADAYKAAVLSGNGASLMNALITKTEPVDIASILPVVLSDPDGLSGGLAEIHPVLSLLQTWIDPADPLNFARATAAEPLEGHVAKHVFQTYGTRDHYSPPITLATYARAAALQQVEPAEDDLADEFGVSLTSTAAPLAGNLAGGMITAGLRQYEAASDSDGHFVVFDVPQANEDAVRFLSQAVSGGIPEIGE